MRTLLSDPEKIIRFSKRAALLVLFFVFHVSAQVAPTGTILGVIKDPSGATVPGVTVTVTNVEQNYTRTTMTGSDGSYRFPGLPVGQYNIKVELSGFKTETQSGLTLDVAQEAVLNFTLEVGAAEQQVVVTGETPQVDTTTSSLGHLVNDQQIADLPLNGRNFVDLTLLQTGVTQFANNNFGTNGLFGEFYSANGAPLRSNMYTLDGAIMGNVQGASASSVSGLSLGVDGIREYKVMTNSFSAEYGLTMGSQMSIVTKSGSNQFHGDVFEYLRNSALDARNYFDLLYTLPSSIPGGGKRIAPFRRNQFGGTLGGPIKKDKTFFFATYEGFRQLWDNPPNLGVTPTFPAACHTPITNPNSVPTIGAGGTITGGPIQFVGSACDSKLKGSATEQVDPFIVPILNLWPNPNIEPGDQFTYLAAESNQEDYAQGRIDHNISSADTLFGRYTFDRANEIYPKIFPLFDFGLYERQQYVTLAENHVFSTAVLNSARVSFSRSYILDSTPSSSNPFAKATTGPQFSCVVNAPMCPINVTSIANFSDTTSTAIDNTQNVFTVGDDVFWTKGKHALKFGTLINYFQQYANNAEGYKGTVSFTSIQSFVLGQYRSYAVPGPGYNAAKYMTFDTLGFYVQDDYHVLPRLTLNLGLRYEFNTQPNEKRGRQSNFVNPPYSNAPVLGPIVGNPSFRDVSPRVGFAWDVFGDGKTSLRGGFAILYDVANLGGVFALEGLAMPPFGTTYTVTNSTSKPASFVLPLPIPGNTGSLQGTSPTTINTAYKSPHMLDFNLAIERQLPFNTALSVAYAGSRGLDLWQPANEANPFCPSTNTFVPQGCSGVTAIVPGALPTWTSTTLPRLNPFFSNFALFNTGGESWYNALEVNLTKRVGHGLEFQSAYTFSKLLDDTEGLSNSDTSGSQTGLIEDPFNPKLEWGPANFDVRHNWRFNILYHLPAAHLQGAMDKIANGWWVGSIVAVQTGTPFSPLLSSDREQAGLAGTNGGLERPNYVTAANIAQVTAQAQAAGLTTCAPNTSGCIPYNPVIYNPKTVITGNPQEWFNPNMFALQPVGTIGNVGRNILTEPGLATWDFSLNKDTALHVLGEAGRIQFRAEMFNLLNHPNFGPAQNGGFFSGSVKDVVEQPAQATGVISTSTPGRQIQFSLKVLF